MSVSVNLKFWKKDEDPFSDDALSDLSGDFETPKNTLSQPDMSSPAAQDPIGSYTPDSHPENVSFAPADTLGTDTTQGQNNTWQYDVIIARLDSIKSQLDVLNHRIEKLEATQQQAQEVRGRGPWYTK